MNSQFAKDVMNGLSGNPKKLSSKYFYDKQGSKIFQDIMKMPEYYLTDCEFEIFETNKDVFLDLFSEKGKFDLVELGSGDGLKTKVLLRNFYQQKTNFTYFPIDISEDAVINLERELNEEMPELSLNPLNDDYNHSLGKLKTNSKNRKIILLLGSNIGNFKIPDAIEFLNMVSDNLNSGDLFLVGFDLKKDPKLIMNAYDDHHGITARFNLNLLDRINKELGADFDKNNFKHHICYNPVLGMTESFLVSTKSQTVSIKNLDLSVHFDYAEPIWMELSQKYDTEMIEGLAHKTGFEIKNNFFDCKHYFCDSVWIKE